MITKFPLAKFAMITSVAVSALALSAASSSAYPRMGTDGDTAWVAVSTGDLDLSSPAGAQAMISRFQSAARKICGPEPTDRLSFGHEYDTCVRETVNRAVVDLGSPSVAAANDKNR
jgi:UrcA family protein